MKNKAKLWLVVGLMTVVAGTGTVYAATTDSSTASNGTHAKTHAHTQGKGDWKGHAGQAGRGFFGFDNQALLTLLKLDKAGLQTQLKAGKSLADIAKAQSVDEQQVIDTIVTAQKQQLTTAVTNGKLTQTQADKMQANLATMAKKMVESTHPEKPHAGGKDFKGKGNLGMNDQALLDVLHITQDQLKQARQAGKSLADIAKDQGVAEQTVIDAVVQQQTTQLADAVKAGKLTQAKADEMKTHFQDFAKKMVEGKPGQGHFQHERGKKQSTTKGTTTSDTTTTTN